jgi:hypothetical protein
MSTQFYHWVTLRTAVMHVVAKSRKLDRLQFPPPPPSSAVTDARRFWAQDGEFSSVAGKKALNFVFGNGYEQKVR